MFAQVLVAALIGYIFRLRWVTVGLVIYFIYIYLGASNDPQMAEKYWRIDLLIYQGVGLFIGAFLHKFRDKKRKEMVSKVNTPKSDDKADETEKDPQTVATEPVSESEHNGEVEDEEDDFLV